MSITSWVFNPNPNHNAKLNLICFPYAGGSAATYIPWKSLIPNEVELHLIQPPGRASRLFEEPHTDMTSLVEELFNSIKNSITRPFIFFGHSLGSRFAFELATKLKSLGLNTPKHFIASGSSAPHFPAVEEKIHNLPENEFIEKLKNLNGTPQEILTNVELMELYLPCLRADFQVAENYTPSNKKISFDCPISVFGGTEDHKITMEKLTNWGKYFKDPADVKLVPGDHFFLESNRKMVVKHVNDILELHL